MKIEIWCRNAALYGMENILTPTARFDVIF